jgi:hypothetical protein
MDEHARCTTLAVMSTRKIGSSFGLVIGSMLALAVGCDSGSASDPAPGAPGGEGAGGATGGGGSGGNASDPSASGSGGSSDPNGGNSPPIEEQGVDGPAQVQLIGRFETQDPAGPKASWPGSRIITRFVGTKISATFSEYAADWMDGAPSYWDVSIDGAPPSLVLAMIGDNLPHTFELAANLPQGPHRVELYKRSETQTGVTQFLGFDLHGGKALPPPPRLARHIEAMADSYGAGYGVEKLDAPELKCGVDHAGQWQNFHKAWPTLLGLRFDAEVEGTIYSGKGLERGVWPTDDDGLIEYYNRANPNPEMAHAPTLFDLTSWVPDAIILSQGTVDAGMTNFRTVYRDFVVNQLRARAPNAHIFLVVPGRVQRDKMLATVTSVEEERHAAGDLKVHSVVPSLEQPHEMTGCGYHGSPAYHQRVADEIGAVMAAKLGW